MRLEPLYRARFTTPERWSVELRGPHGTEAQSLLFAEGRCEGRVAARLRAANFPRRRTDDTLTPDFRGVLETANFPRRRTDDPLTPDFRGVLEKGRRTERYLRRRVRAADLLDSERSRRMHKVST